MCVENNGIYVKREVCVGLVSGCETEDSEASKQSRWGKTHRDHSNLQVDALAETVVS